jgi:FkbM family methyltransferase
MITSRVPTILGPPVERLWLRVLPTLTRDYLCVSVHGFRLYGSVQHRPLLHWIAKGSYERFTRKLFQRALEPGMRALDVGANIGYYTLLAANAVGSTGKVYSFECDPANARFLRHNVKLNGVADVVTIVPKAATSHAGVVQLFADRTNSLLSSLVVEGQATASIEVESTTVDDAISPLERIDVAKVDVEGGEVDAIRGMSETISRTERLVMFVECCPSALSSAGASVGELLDELQRHRFQVSLVQDKSKSLTTDLSELFAAERSGSEKYYVNLYCVKGS